MVDSGILWYIIVYYGVPTGGNIRIPIMSPSNGRGCINHGSGLGLVG